MIHPAVSPALAIAAGILILIFPEFLNLVVAIYLIAFGVMGFMAAF